MKRLFGLTAMVLAMGCRTGASGASGSAVVEGTVDGLTLATLDVAGFSGTQGADGGVSGFAGVLISNRVGTCAAAMAGGVRAATSNANVLEIVATTPGAPVTPGTYPVGNSGLAEYFYLKGGAVADGIAGGGTITFDSMDATTISGRFAVNLAGGIG